MSIPLNWGITWASRTVDLASREAYRQIADQSLSEQKHPVSRDVGVTKTIGHPSSCSKLGVTGGLGTHRTKDIVDLVLTFRALMAFLW